VLMRKLGRTGLKVAALCLGGNTFGWTTDQTGSEAVLDAYGAAGGNFIDTADVYSRWAPGHSGGESETVLGRWMKARGNRHQVIIATKVMGPMGPGPNDTGLSRHHIIDAVEASLRRLQTDYIDLYQAHWDDRETPLAETLRAFDDLVRQGKVRYVGASNYHAWRLTRALWESDRHGYARYETIQPKYNLVMRDEYERELEPLCLGEEIGVITYSSLGSGFLSGKYRADRDLPATPRAAGVAKQYMNPRGFAVLSAVDKVAEAVGAPPSQVALAWIVHRPGITAPIVSATGVAQLQELLGALDLRLDAEAIATLDKASAWRDAS
jgi:aryl-alcohol dehydrogenase-like predicted oxidoreductase